MLLKGGFVLVQEMSDLGDDSLGLIHVHVVMSTLDMDQTELGVGLVGTDGVLRQAARLVVDAGGCL